MARSSSIGQIGLRIFCVMVLVFAGIAHRPMTAMAAAPSDLAIYVLPDGSIPSLCVTDTDGTKPVKHLDRGCEVCRIASGTILPLPQRDTTAIVRTAFVEPFVAKSEQFHRLLFPPNARPRGPPSFLNFT
jgi:hypothetical protein